MLFDWELRPKQLEIFSYVVEKFLNLEPDHTLQVQIIGAYGVGKTTLEAMLIVTILYLYDLIRDRSVVEGFKARLLSGSEKQVNTVMWREIELMLMVSRIGTKFKLESTKLVYLPFASIVLDKFIWNARNEQSQTGAHGGLVSIFFDEGTAISDLAYKTAFNYFSGRGQKGTWIITGNANKRNCEFEKISEQNDWKTFKWTRFCDLQEGQEDPYANRIREKYGEDSDEWRVGVMAEFPLLEESALISRYVLNLAVERDKSRVVPNARPIYIGIDVATGINSGDYSVICVRNNHEILEWWRAKVGIEVLKQVYSDFHAHYRPRVIVPDEVCVGAGFAEWLKIHFHNHESEVIAFHAGKSPEYNTAVSDRRSEVAFLAAEWLRDIGRIPYHEDFFEECSWIKWQVTEKAKLKLISKNEMKRSTDMFDAFSYTFARKYSDTGERLSTRNTFIGMNPAAYNARTRF